MVALSCMGYLTYHFHCQQCVGEKKGRQPVCPVVVFAAFVYCIPHFLVYLQLFHTTFNVHVLFKCETQRHLCEVFDDDLNYLPDSVLGTFLLLSISCY